jgi:hypothetical protein
MNAPRQRKAGLPVFIRPPKAENTRRSPTFTDSEGAQAFASSIAINRVIVVAPIGF